MRASRGLRFSPAGESLSFAWPKESNQRKSHPWRVGLRLPCDARRPGRCGNSPWRAQTPRTFPPRPAALLGDTRGAPKHAPVLGGEMALRDGGSGGCSPSALPIWRARAGAPPTRPGKAHKTCLAAELGHGSALVPPAHAKSGTRRAAMWGSPFLWLLSFGHAKESDSPKGEKRSRSAAADGKSNASPILTPAPSNPPPAPLPPAR